MDSRLTSSAVERRGTAKAGRKLLLHFRHFRWAGAQVPRRPWMAERGRHPWRSDEGGARRCAVYDVPPSSAPPSHAAEASRFLDCRQMHVKVGRPLPPEGEVTGLTSDIPLPARTVG